MVRRESLLFISYAAYQNVSPRLLDLRGCKLTSSKQALRRKGKHLVLIFCVFRVTADKIVALLALTAESMLVNINDDSTVWAKK